jgi:hypothetical protein
MGKSNNEAGDMQPTRGRVDTDCRVEGLCLSSSSAISRPEQGSLDQLGAYIFGAWSPLCCLPRKQPLGMLRMLFDDNSGFAWRLHGPAGGYR